MKLRSILLPALALAAFGATSTATAQNATQYVYVPGFGAKLGEPAPTLVSPTWVKGSPVLFEPGKVTVLSFWATWCVPCRETFPGLAELSKKYRGKVNFAGISVWEKPEDVKSGAYVNKVRTFARSLGSQMPYSVSVDDAKNTNAIRWLGQFTQGIPKSFIIDQSGRVAWSGHPLADLEEVLEKVVAGNYDLQKQVQRQHIQVMSETQMRNFNSPLTKALVVKEPKQAVAAIDDVIAKNPSLEASLGTAKFQNLLKYDEKEAYAYARKLADGANKNQPLALNLIAWTIVDDASKLRNPDIKTAVYIAQRASELANHEDGYILDTLAYALYKNGDKSKALELQIKAVELAEKMQGANPRILAEMRERLALFKRTAR